MYPNYRNHIVYGPPDLTCMYMYIDVLRLHVLKHPLLHINMHELYQHAWAYMYMYRREQPRTMGFITGQGYIPSPNINVDYVRDNGRDGARRNSECWYMYLHGISLDLYSSKRLAQPKKYHVHVSNLSKDFFRVHQLCYIYRWRRNHFILFWFDFSDHLRFIEGKNMPRVRIT